MTINISKGSGHLYLDQSNAPGAPTLNGILYCEISDTGVCPAFELVVRAYEKHYSDGTAQYLLRVAGLNGYLRPVSYQEHDCDYVGEAGPGALLKLIGWKRQRNDGLRYIEVAAFSGH